MHLRAAAVCIDLQRGAQPRFCLRSVSSLTCQRWICMFLEPVQPWRPVWNRLLCDWCRMGNSGEHVVRIESETTRWLNVGGIRCYLETIPFFHELDFDLYRYLSLFFLHGPAGKFVSCFAYMYPLHRVFGNYSQGKQSGGPIAHQMPSPHFLLLEILMMSRLIRFGEDWIWKTFDCLQHLMNVHWLIGPVCKI